MTWAMEYLSPRKEFLPEVKGWTNMAFASANDSMVNYSMLQQETIKNADLVFHLFIKYFP